MGLPYMATPPLGSSMVVVGGVCGWGRGGGTGVGVGGAREQGQVREMMWKWKKDERRTLNKCQLSTDHVIWSTGLRNPNVGTIWKALSRWFPRWGFWGSLIKSQQQNSAACTGWICTCNIPFCRDLKRDSNLIFTVAARSVFAVQFSVHFHE